MSLRRSSRHITIAIGLAGLAFACVPAWAGAQEADEPPPEGEVPTACSTAQVGTGASDTLRGTPEGDRIDGKGGRDRLAGLDGADCLIGGFRADTLVGGGGRDRIVGGPGADRINARDGTRDLVRCGRGRDRARLDRSDRESGCKWVNRGAAKRDDDGSATPPPSGGGDPCEFGSFSADNPPGACWRPYSDSSPFNRELPAAPSEESGSSSIVDRIMHFGAAGDRGGTWFTGGVADTGSDYDHPIYYSQPTDPVYTVHCRKWVSSCSVEGMQIRIPAEARPAGGTDAHLGVIDQDSGWEYGFWETESRSPDGGTLWIGYGGRTRIGTDDAMGIGTAAIPNGVTAAHFGLAAGAIRPEELEAGEIDHALFMVVKCTNGTYVWPARGPGVARSCSSIGLSNSNAPALGQHFYLDMSAGAIDAHAVPEWKKTILHAMAEYGMFVGDTGSDYLGWSVLVQSGSSYTSFGQPDPWVSLAKRYGIPSSSGRYYFDLKDTVNWGSTLSVAEPCVSQGVC
jgi:hypothetical protein